MILNTVTTTTSVSCLLTACKRSSASLKIVSCLIHLLFSYYTCFSIFGTITFTGVSFLSDIFQTRKTRTKKLLLMHSCLRPQLERPFSTPCKLSLTLNLCYSVTKVHSLVSFPSLCGVCWVWKCLVTLSDTYLLIWSQGSVCAVYFAKLEAVNCKQLFISASWIERDFNKSKRLILCANLGIENNVTTCTPAAFPTCTPFLLNYE
jgi:hypothetical protein